MDDLLYFQDDTGKEIGLMMIDNFDFQGRSYALLASPHDEADGGVYVMRMEHKDGELSFEMPDDEEMTGLTPVIMAKLEEMSGGCIHDCCSCHGCSGEHEDFDCDDEDCDCEH